MPYIPCEKLSINWAENDQSFKLSLPWLSMEIDVTEEDKGWIKDATHHLQSSVSNQNVQKFIHELKDYPIFYIQPRSIEEFEGKDLQSCPFLDVNTSTPAAFIATFGCAISDELKSSISPCWTWNRERILNKSQIPGTNLYDPVSFISYLICYRLEWESTSWSGQDGFGQFLEGLLKRDEEQFFQAIGWVSKQSWYVTTESCKSMEPALTHFEKAKEYLHHYMCDEAGHYKFMEQVFQDIGLKKEDFTVGDATKWLLGSHKRTSTLSPLAFSAMLNIFEAAYYEGLDPLSRVIKMSSKPHAAQGYDLHYKINQEHRHCDVPAALACYLAPQSLSHALLTLCLFELTINFLDQMEKRVAMGFERS